MATDVQQPLEPQPLAAAAAEDVAAAEVVVCVDAAGFEAVGCSTASAPYSYRDSWREYQ